VPGKTDLSNSPKTSEIKIMKRIKKTATNIFLIATCLSFLFSCASVDQQKQKDTKKPPPQAPVVKEAEKPQPKTQPEVKESPLKLPPVAEKYQQEHKAAPPKQQAPKAPPVPLGLSTQQKYYNMGMRYYSQEKYREAKKAWQRVIKLGRRTSLAEKARENIKKVDQILKTLKEMSGR
jgi:type IV secretory pathway VirB10-like protein